MKKVVFLVIIMTLMFGVISFGKAGNGDVYWLKGNLSSQTINKTTTKTYDEVYQEEGLLASIVYFNINYENFTSEARKEFASRISWEINSRGNEYRAVNYIKAASIPAQPLIEFVDSLYPGIYDGELNVLKLYKLDSQIRDAVRKIMTDKVFMVTKAYYIMEETFEDSGFKLTIHPEIYTMLKKALDLTFNYKNGIYVDQYGHEVPGLSEISIPEEIVDWTDRSWDSKATYPKVLVEDVELLELLKGAWKTHAYIPLYIEELKNYDQIYGQGGLMACINYFDANYDLFSEKERITFAERIVSAINEKGNEYSIVNGIKSKQVAVPNTLENVNTLYPGIYDKDTNTLSIKLLDSESGIRECIQQVKEDEVFLLTKSYFVMEDVFNNNGFRLTIHPNTFKKLKRALDLVYNHDNFDSYVSKDGGRLYGLDAIAMPQELVTASDNQWSSEKTYPKVLVESPDKLKLLEGGWKVEVYVPVNIQEKSLDKY